VTNGGPGAPTEPLAVRATTWFALAFAVGTGGVLVLAGTGLVSQWSIAGQAVTREQFLRLAGPVLGFAGACAAAIAYGFRTRRAWSRHLVPALFGGVALLASSAFRTGELPREMAWQALTRPLVMLGVTVWYFYFKRNVADYFRSLR